MTKIITPAEADAIKAAAAERHQVWLKLMQDRYDAAIKYLDDGKWLIPMKTRWLRSYDGNKLDYYVDKDRFSIAEPGKKATYWYSNAFVTLYTIAQETEGGFGENTIESLFKQDRRRTPVSNILYLNKLNPVGLTSQQKRWAENIPPPREVLADMVKWDDYLKLLVKFHPGREQLEYVFDQNFVELNGETYAIWRVRSVLMFGNPDGNYKNEAAQKAFAEYQQSSTPLLPKEKTPRLSRKKRYKTPTTPSKPVPIDRDAPEKEQRFDSMVAAGRIEKELINESKKAEQVRKRLARSARARVVEKKKRQEAAAPAKLDRQEQQLQRILDKRAKEEQAKRIQSIKQHIREKLAEERKAERYE